MCCMRCHNYGSGNVYLTETWDVRVVKSEKYLALHLFIKTSLTLYMKMCFKCSLAALHNI